MIGGINWSELFPSESNVLIFVTYISLFICQGILLTASQNESNKYDYNTVCVVLLTELLKLMISTVLYCRSGKLSALSRDVLKNKHLCLLYFVPAFLYCLYNNLAFVNLSKFDPTTYYLLLQLRVVITGILFQIFFKKSLNQRQWLSLLLLTFGCMIKQVAFDSPFAENDDVNLVYATANPAIMAKNTNGFDLSINAVYILVQLICSCLAGVYNEYLLKSTGADVDIYVQNVFMYFDSIICNLILLMLEGNLSAVFNVDTVKSILTLKVLLIMLNNAAVGIITCFFLKYLNSILKTFASALELMFTAIFCYILFGMPIHMSTVFSISIVSLAIYLYSLSPVVNFGDKRQRKPHNDDDSQTGKLLHSDSETV